MQRVLIVFFVMAVLLFILAFIISLRSPVYFVQEKLEDRPPCNNQYQPITTAPPYYAKL